MNEEQLYSIDVLNVLYVAERRSLLPRLAELNTFISWASADELEIIKRFRAEEHEHQEWLSEAIFECGGSPRPASADINTANLHYLTLHAIMPSVLKNLENLAGAYAEAGTLSPLTSHTAEIISRIGRRHQSHLQQLRQVGDRAVAAQPA